MTLTAVEAEEIVADCIRSAVGFEGLISGGNRLNQVGVVDDDAVDALIDEIVTNPQVGVPSRGHEIDPESLDLTTSTRVSQTQVQVIQNATVALQSRGLSMSASSARATTAGGRKAGAKKGATKRSAAKKTAGKRDGAKKGAKKTAPGGAKRAARKAGGGRRK
jgi:hypothetical protein